MLNGCLWPHDGPLDVAHAQSVAHVQTAPKRLDVHQAHKRVTNEFLVGFKHRGSQTDKVWTRFLTRNASPS